MLERGDPTSRDAARLFVAMPLPAFYFLARRFTRFPEMAEPNRRASLFLDCSYRGNSLHNAYRPNTKERERETDERRGTEARDAIQKCNLNFRTHRSGNFFNVYSFKSCRPAHNAKRASYHPHRFTDAPRRRLSAPRICTSMEYMHTTEPRRGHHLARDVFLPFFVRRLSDL